MNGGSQHCTRGSDQTMSKKKKCKMAKWFPEDALQIAEKKQKAKEKRKDTPI